jgi:hypothetical protein
MKKLERRSRAWVIMSSVKIEFHPTLEKAVESLKKGEGLYTDSRFLLDPVRIVYKREAKSVYKAIGLDHEGTTWDLGGGDKVLVSSHLEKSGKKYVHATLIKGKEIVKLDTENLYKSLILKPEELGELIEGLISLVEKNGNVFKKPIKDVILIGLKGLNIKNRDFVVMEDISAYNRQEKEAVVDFIRKQILKSRKGITTPHSLYFGDKAEKELYKTLSNLTRETETYYYWTEVLIAVDRMPDKGVGKVVTALWEDNEVLGIESGGRRDGGIHDLIYELRGYMDKHGKESLEKSFPRVLGKISLYVSERTKREEAEFVLVPLRIEEKEKVIEVDYLALTKLGIKDRKFVWSSVSPTYFEDLVNIRISGENSIRMLKKDEVPREALEDEKGKNNILVKVNVVEGTEIGHIDFDEKRAFRNKDQLLAIKHMKYAAYIEGSTKKLSIEVGYGSLIDGIKGCEEIEEGSVIKEEINTNVLLRREIDPKIKKPIEKEGTECLGEGTDGLVIEELKRIISRLRNLKEREQKEERKGILKTATFVAERVQEILGKGKEIKGIKSKCIPSGNGKYVYKVYQEYNEGSNTASTGRLRPIAEEEELINTLKKFLLPKVLKQAEKLASLLKSEEGAKVCFTSEGKKINIVFDDLEEMSKPSKEEIILRYVSRNLVKGFLRYNYADKIREKSGKISTDEEVKEIDKLALELSGSIVSSIVHPWKKFVPIESRLGEIMETIYIEVFKTLTGGAYKQERRKYGTLGWAESGEPMIYGKELLKNALGTLIEVKMIKEISAWIPPGERDEPKVMWSFKIDNISTKPTFFLETGVDGVVAEIKKD